MEIRLTLALPRDELSVPVARRICTHSMRSLGVDDECAHDVEVAVTEACTNVLDHVVDGDEYEITLSVDDRRCVIEVVDTGRGFDHSALSVLGDADTSAEQGRGIQIMQALVDRVEFISRPETGTICHLEKDLTWADGSMMKALTDGHR